MNFLLVFVRHRNELRNVRNSCLLVFCVQKIFESSVQNRTVVNKKVRNARKNLLIKKFDFFFFRPERKRAGVVVTANHTVKLRFVQRFKAFFKRLFCALFYRKFAFVNIRKMCDFLPSFVLLGGVLF